MGCFGDGCKGYKGFHVGSTNSNWSLYAELNAPALYEDCQIYYKPILH